MYRFTRSLTRAFRTPTHMRQPWRFSGSMNQVYHMLFSVADTDKDGNITKDELTNIIDTLNGAQNKKEMEKWWKKKVKAKRSIDQQQFIQYMREVEHVTDRETF